MWFLETLHAVTYHQWEQIRNVILIRLTLQNNEYVDEFIMIDGCFITKTNMYLRYLCLFAHSGVQQILCCVRALFSFVLCTRFCQFRRIVHFWLTLRYSLTFIYVLRFWNWRKKCRVYVLFHSIVEYRFLYQNVEKHILSFVCFHSNIDWNCMLELICTTTNDWKQRIT